MRETFESIIFEIIETVFSEPTLFRDALLLLYAKQIRQISPLVLLENKVRIILMRWMPIISWLDWRESSIICYNLTQFNNEI